MKKLENIKLLYVDLFCGAGGTSTGVEQAKYQENQCAKVIACVNHDKNAIASHASNHPDTIHFTEDIRTLRLDELISHLNYCKSIYPDAHVVLWASLECTNFSRAKGGQPRNADSRTLAEHLFRYIDALHPDFLQIENVEEFMSWGDVDENGKPISRDKGKSYLKWISNVRSRGYNFDYRILNAANYGAYTTRKRFFGIFAKEGFPIVFPEATYTKNPGNDLFSRLKKWKAVREVLDFSDEGRSIFGRKKNLSERTLQRIYAGLMKFAARDKYEKKDRITFLSKQFSGHPSSKNVSLENPAGTVTTIDHHAFVQAFYGNGFNRSINDSCATVTTRDRFALVIPKSFISAMYGNGFNRSVNESCPTVTTTNKNSLITPIYILNTQYNAKGRSINDPCFTLVARMDKVPPYIVSIEGGIGIKVEKDDSEATRKIKHFMAMHGLIDIKMRMLRVQELKQIMGFPADYVLKGTQAEQKKFIGNAVEVNMARVLCESLVEAISMSKTNRRIA